MIKKSTLTNPNDVDRHPVEILAEQFAQRLRDGERPTIEQYVEQYPEHKAMIQVLFPPIEMMERVSEQEHKQSDRADTDTTTFTLTSNVIGDFHIVREIGRGGMGVVFEAQQQSLNRRVALKILGSTVSCSSSQLSRFHREAEAAARLHHTNIVPVFGTGTNEGLHYYAMQYIDGVSLSDIISLLTSMENDTGTSERQTSESTSSSSESRLSGARFVLTEAVTILLDEISQDADQIEVERIRSLDDDLPATERFAPCKEEVRIETNALNIDTDNDTPESIANDNDFQSIQIVKTQESCKTKSGSPELRNGDYWRNVAKIGAELADALSHSHQHGILHRDVKPSNILLDRDGIVWLADFGLAKHQDQQDVTNVGDIVGTLRYMAPEQFRGQTDERSDIYSLGLTLYELLTLEPAFEENNHGPLIEQKLAPTPLSPRRVLPHFPRDLDTIIVKACQADPAYRYQSASELAADLERFLEDRPIHARRVTALERFWRWARRNPQIAILATSTAIFLIATAVVFAVGKHRTQQALGLLAEQKRHVDQALLQVEQENIRAETNLRIAINAFEEITSNISSRGVSQSLTIVPGEEVSAVTPADAELLETLLTFFDQFAKHNPTDFSVETASSLRRVGDIHYQLGRLDMAEESYDRALAAYNLMIENGESVVEYSLETARIMNAMAGIQTRRGNIPEAIAAHRSTVILLENHASKNDASIRFELAKTLIQTLLVPEDAGMDSSVAMGKKGGHSSAHGRNGPGGPGGRKNGPGPGAYGSSRNGPGFGGPGPGGRGNGGPKISKEGSGGPRAGGPGGGGPKGSRSGPGGHRSGGPAGFGGPGYALANCNRAIDILNALISEDASKVEYRFVLAQAYRVRVRALSSKEEEAEKSLHSSIELLTKLANEYPGATAIQYELADTLCTQLKVDENYQERIERAVALSAKLAIENLGIPQYQSLAGECLSQLAAIDSEAGKLDDAVVKYERALAYLQPLAVRLDGVLPAQLTYARASSSFAKVLIDNNQSEDASSILDDAIACLEAFDRNHGSNRFVSHLLNQLRQRRSSILL